MTLWSRGLARSHDKLKPLYLYYYSPYGHQTWLDSDLPEDLSTIKSINTDHVVLQSHMINQNRYISTTRVPMATRLDEMLTYFEWLQSIYSPDPLITSSC